MIPYTYVGPAGGGECAMAFTFCTQCSASVPAEAKFCPRCGQHVERGGGGGPARDVGTGAGASNRAPGALPSSSPMPLAGILFLVAAVLGPTLIAVGVSTGSALVLVAGIGIAILLIAVLLAGMVF